MASLAKVRPQSKNSSKILCIRIALQEERKKEAQKLADGLSPHPAP